MSATIAGNIANSGSAVAFAIATGDEVGDETKDRGVDSDSGSEDAMGIDIGTGVKVEDGVGVTGDVAAQATDQPKTTVTISDTRIFIFGHAFLVIDS